jgi:hypothetical protein
MKRNVLTLAFSALCCCGLLGCGADTNKLEGVVPVSGTVTQNGTPLEGAAVSFAPAGGGRSASGKTDAAGKFTLTTLNPGDGAMPGEYKVTITKKEMVGKEYTEEEANAYYNEHQKQPPAPEMKNLIDEKYSNADTSGLMASVPEGGVTDLKYEVE